MLLQQQRIDAEIQIKAQKTTLLGVVVKCQMLHKVRESGRRQILQPHLTPVRHRAAYQGSASATWGRLGLCPLNLPLEATLGACEVGSSATAPERL